MWDSAAAGTARALPGGSRQQRRGGLVEGWRRSGGASVSPMSPQRERRGGKILHIKMRPEGEKPLGILIKEKGVYDTACECGDSNAGRPGCFSPS
jgi:hypothetical protein